MKYSTILTSKGLCSAILIVHFVASLCWADGDALKQNDSVSEPIGRISLPLMGSLTGNRVNVSGYTDNLKIENKYVWLVIENSKKGVCWPQNEALTENSRFSTTINATGHVNSFIVSLYAVNSNQNKRILNWLASSRSKGLTLLPQQTRLYSIRLWNQKLDM